MLSFEASLLIKVNLYNILKYRFFMQNLDKNLILIPSTIDQSSVSLFIL